MLIQKRRSIQSRKNLLVSTLSTKTNLAKLWSYVRFGERPSTSKVVVCARCESVLTKEPIPNTNINNFSCQILLLPYKSTTSLGSIKLLSAAVWVAIACAATNRAAVMPHRRYGSRLKR